MTTYDLDTAPRRSPSLMSLLDRTGLTELVTYTFDERGYNWLLADLIESRMQDPGSSLECVDFCFIDGAHTWRDDGLAFFLVHRVLRPGGWVLFDDLTFTFANSHWAGPRLGAMTKAERQTPQVGRVFELLVEPHPGYDVIVRWRGWGWARKRPVRGVTAPSFTRRQLLAVLEEAKTSAELAQRDADEIRLRAERGVPAALRELGRWEASVS